MVRELYAAQAAMLVRVLPYVAEEECFALKGGTAINMFYRDLPRLSVDIDLAYLPIQDRDQSLTEICAALDRITERINRALHLGEARRIAGDGATRIQVWQGRARIKIETSPVARGVLHEPEHRTVTDAVEEEFGFAEIKVVSFEDLFGGKLHAAVDRQHPRDLFDVHLLYQNEGLTDALFRTFLIYIASSPRPAHELLNPNPIALDQPYAREFEGMTRTPVDLAALTDTRARLFADLRTRLDNPARTFLLSLHDGAPDFDAINVPKAAELPAVRWKLINLNKLKTENPVKHEEQRGELEKLFSDARQN